MQITAIKTPIVKLNDDLFEIVKSSVKFIPEESVFIVTSKIISYCQGRVVAKTTEDKSEKHNLIRSEADLYLEPHSSKYNLMLTVKNHTLAVNAGIDESNVANGGYILWPENLQETANEIWRFLREHYKVKKVGVLITDSKSFPLRWGVIGTFIAHCGFKSLHNFIGEKDLFDREIQMVQVNVAEAVATAAVLEMGEVAEQTPLALVEEIKLIEFQDREPTEKELEDAVIEPEDDVYAPVLMNAKWKKGRK